MACHLYYKLPKAKNCLWPFCFIFVFLSTSTSAASRKRLSPPVEMKEDTLVSKMPGKFQVAAGSRELTTVGDSDEEETIRTSFGRATYENPAFSSSDWSIEGSRLTYNGTLRLKSQNFHNSSTEESDDSAGIWFEHRKWRAGKSVSLLSGRVSYAQPLLTLHIDLSLKGPFVYFGDFEKAQFEYLSVTGLRLNELKWSIETVIPKGDRWQGQWMFSAAERVKHIFLAGQENAIAEKIMKAIESQCTEVMVKAVDQS